MVEQAAPRRLLPEGSSLAGSTPLYEEGPFVNWRRRSIAQSGRALSRWLVGSCAHLSIASSRGGQGRFEFAPVANLLKDCQAARGRWRLWERRVGSG